MYKRHNGQASMLKSPEMFGSLPLDQNNEWIKLRKLIPWREFELKYAENFRSKKGQRAIASRMALGALLIKPAYKTISDEDITPEIAMNPYLQYFLRLHEYRYECPFDPSMMTRFRQLITPEMQAWVNDRIIGRKTKEDKHDDSSNGSQDEENTDKEETAEEDNEGILILDATCAPQNIRLPTDASLLNEAREKAEFFQLAPNSDSEQTGRCRFCTGLNNGHACAGDTRDTN